MNKRRSMIGNWEHLWQASIFLFLCSLLFAFPVAIAAYIFGCLYAGFPVFLPPSAMSREQSVILVSILFCTALLILYMTLMLTVLYNLIIYRPATEILHVLNKKGEASSPAQSAESYLRGGSKSPFDLYHPRSSWADRVNDYIRSATQEQYIDKTTGCLNHKYYAESVEEILKTQLLCALSYSNQPGVRTNNYIYGIFLVDIDHFKRINDEFGHVYGDQVLMQVGRTLRLAVEDVGGIVIRNGGEEFLVIVCMDYPGRFSQIAEKIRRDFSETVLVTDARTHEVRQVTCSIGYLPFPLFRDSATAFSVQQHLNLSDQAMYIAKTEGRNTWRGIIPEKIPRTQFELEQSAVSLEYGIQRGYFQIARPMLSGDSEGLV